MKQANRNMRLRVFRSNKLVYAQVIEDGTGKIQAAARGKDGAQVGNEVAKIALKNGVKKVKFDRGGYAYHGRVKSLADGARAGGLIF